MDEHACSNIYLYLQYLPESNKKVDGSEAHNKIHKWLTFHKMQPGSEQMQPEFRQTGYWFRSS